MKINTVIVDIYRPKEETGYPGQVEEGQYIVEGGIVTLTDHAGVPLRARDGTMYSQKLEKQDDPHVIAGRLTKKRWRDRPANSDFNRPLRYPKVSF